MRIKSNNKKHNNEFILLTSAAETTRIKNTTCLAIIKTVGNQEERRDRKPSRTAAYVM